MRQSGLLQLWRSPENAPRFSVGEWRITLPAARHARLLAQLAVRIEDAGVLNLIPGGVINQLRSARISAEAAARSLRWEAGEIRHTLERREIPFVLIKGAAYAAARLPLAIARTAADVDILVPPDSLACAESALLSAGWEHTAIDPGEERHVRIWLHQVPALRHRVRGTAVDLHHAVSPPKGRLAADTSLIQSAARPSFWPGCLVPSPTDMTLISVVHLCRETEIDIALRDLVDFDALIRDFSADARFGAALSARATTLGLWPALFFAARAALRLLGTPLPDGLVSSPDGAPIIRSSRSWIDRMVDLAILPDGPDPPGLRVRTARGALRIRALMVQMPVSRMALRSARDKALRLRALPGRVLGGDRVFGR